MIHIPFSRLKRMSHYELKEVKFKLEQDMKPRYCTEADRIKDLKGKLNYVKYLLYNPQGQAIVQANTA